MSDPRAPRIGEAAPWFACRTSRRESFSFDTVAGRHIVLFFFGSTTNAEASRALEALRGGAGRACFDDEQAALFGVTTDPEDERQQRVADALPGVRFFFDFDGTVSKLYGALQPDGRFEPRTFILDPTLRVLSSQPLTEGGEAHAAAVLAALERLPKTPPSQPAGAHAPVLVTTRVFEPQLCRLLIDYYHTHDPQETGFMRDVEGETKYIIEHEHKRRRDCTIEDERLRLACMHRIHDRLLSQIERAFQYRATRMERYIVAGYSAEEQGHFRPHRDNTTKGTAHRRFAVSLFLNSDYEGGCLRFPEYGSALYTAPVGGAVVFSCSLLHEATPVTRGTRYMFLPFLYDDAARRIRDENMQFLDPKLRGESSE